MADFENVSIQYNKDSLLVKLHRTGVVDSEKLINACHFATLYGFPSCSFLRIKIAFTILCILIVFCLSACGRNISGVNTQNVDSEMYSQNDINSAIGTIKKEFKSN